MKQAIEYVISLLICALKDTRTVQPVATCRQLPYVHKPAIVKLLWSYLQFPIQVCFPCNDEDQPATPTWHGSVCWPCWAHAQPAADKAPTSVTDTLASPTHSWTHLWNW